MQVAQRGLGVSSHNLAHASDVNYARQRLEIRDSGTIREGDILVGTGVHVEKLSDARNAYIDSQILQSHMDVGLYKSRFEGLTAIENSLGESIDRRLDSPDLTGAIGANKMPLGISKSIDDLFGSFSKWAALPGVLPPKETMLANARLLASDFNRASNHLEKASANAQTGLTQAVSRASQMLDQLASINKEIMSLEGIKSGSALDLRGARQTLLEDLGQLIGFKVEPSSINLNALKLSTLDASGNEVLLVDAAASFGPLSVSGGDVLLDGVTLSINRGSIAGLQSVIKTDVPGAQNSLDVFASHFVKSVNTVYNPNGTAGEDFFDPNGLEASTMKVDPSLSIVSLRSSTTGLPGGNDIAFALEELRSKRFSISGGDPIEGTLSEAYGSLVSTLGQQLNVTKTQLEASQSLADRLSEDRTNDSGVSYEEELASLMSFSHLFQANLKVLNICDSCLDEIIHSIRL